MSDNGNGTAGGGARGEGFGGAAQGAEKAAGPGAGMGGPALGAGYGQWGQPGLAGAPGSGAQGQAAGGMQPQGPAPGAGQAQQQAPWAQSHPGLGAHQGQWQAAPLQGYPSQTPGQGWPYPGAMGQGQVPMGPGPAGAPGPMQVPSWTAAPGHPDEVPMGYAPMMQGAGYGAHAGSGGGMGAGPHGGAGMSQLMQEIAGGGNGLSSLTQMLNLDDKELWKGALIGAAAVLLLTNESVQNALFKTGVRARDAVKSGVEKVKASAASASAELAKAGKQAAGGGDE